MNGSWASEARVPAWMASGGNLFLVADHHPVSSEAAKTVRGFSAVPFGRALIPFTRAPPVWLHYLPNVPTLNNFTLWG